MMAIMYLIGLTHFRFVYARRESESERNLVFFCMLFSEWHTLVNY